MSIQPFSSFFKKVYQNTVNSIAFYPTVLAVGILALAWLCLYIDAISYGTRFVEFFSFLVVRNAETARTLLAILAGGLISLMAFSFSMVMIVLNQTASSYSPRVLPGLVSRREHQIVLGLYLGTIGYTLAVLSNVDSETFELIVPQFSIVVNIILVLSCFAAFIYFIHDISTIIQVGNILKRLYYQTHSVLLRELSGGKYINEVKGPDMDHKVKAWQSGYFFSVMEKSFQKSAKKHNLKVKLHIHQGQFLLKGAPFLEVNQPVSDEVLELLMSTFMFRHQELITDNFSYGFKQITEIAVKALSPGINDPGTAIQAIDYLTDLFQIILQLKGQRAVKDKEGTVVLLYLSPPFREIFYFCLTSLRNYAATDVVVLAKLVTLIRKTAETDTELLNNGLYQSELDAIVETTEKTLKSQKDIFYIKGLINQKSLEN